MATPNLTTAGGLVELMKDVYLPNLISLIGRELVLLNKIGQADSEELVGKNIILAIEVSASGGIAMASDLTDAMTIPAGTSDAADQMTIPLRAMYGSIDMPQVAVKRMQAPKGSWTKPWERGMKNLQTRMMQVLAKGYYGDGTGTLATVSAFANTGGSGGRDLVTVNTTRHLAKHDVIDFQNHSAAYADLANGTDIEILDVVSGTQFECAMTGTPTSGDRIAMANSYAKGANGLDVIIDTSSTFQGVARATNYWAQSNVIKNNDGSGNASFKPLKAQILLNQIKARTGIKHDFWLATGDVASSIAWVLYPDRRFDNRGKMEVFDTGMTMSQLPVYVDDDATPNRIYAVTMDALVRGQIGQLVEPFQAPDGSGFIRIVRDASSHLELTKWRATFEHYGNLACRRADQLGVITEVAGLTDGGYGNTGGYVD